MRRKTVFTAFLLISGIVFLSSCGGLSLNDPAKEPNPQPIPRPAVIQRPVTTHDPTMAAGLWREATFRNTVQDLRARVVGDLVTVNIVETSRATKKAATKTGRQSSIDAGITNAMGWETKLYKLAPPNVFDNTAMFKANMTNAFDGSGETSRDESMTASITARVMEVLPNRNLFIKGTRKIRVNNEAQYITLTGIIRPEDISPDNTILSSYVAEATIEYTGRGAVSDKQRPGWLMRAVDFVWPF
jgi:flagellar L-ring protein precursor FlgH